MAEWTKPPDREAPTDRQRGAGAPDEPAPLPYGKQPCLQCGYLISAVAGSKAAICPCCGFKDPCC